MKIKNVVCSILILLLCNSKEAASEPPGDDFISFQSHGKDNVTDNRMGARRNEIGVSRRFEELRQRANFGFNPLMSNASRNMEYLHKGRFSTAVSKGFEEDYDEDYLATESKSNIGQNIHSKGGEAKDKAFTRNFYLDVLLHSKIRLLNLKRQSEGKHPIDVERTPIHGGSAGNRIGVSIKVTMLIPDSKNIDFPYIINSPGGEPEDAPVLDKVYHGDLDKNTETILKDIETAADAAEPRLGARQDWLPKKRWKLHQRVALANYW
ncbi:hypothetical protein HY522_05330, partial [bacterium]|nr:hypothetical protein [bacterium]